MFFEAMKAVLAVQRDHGNREVRATKNTSTPGHQYTSTPVV